MSNLCALLEYFFARDRFDRTAEKYEIYKDLTLADRTTETWRAVGQRMLTEGVDEIKGVDEKTYSPSKPISKVLEGMIRQAHNAMEAETLSLTHHGNLHNIVITSNRTRSSIKLSYVGLAI